MAINVSLLVPLDSGYLFAKEFICGLSTIRGMITNSAKKKVKQIMQEKGYRVANWWEPRFGNHYIILEDTDWELVEMHRKYVERKPIS